jgi:UDP-N-acetylmuramate: L-alanyl-gamma-D-glutamyl-meso-diaminopimelate ligase
MHPKIHFIGTNEAAMADIALALHRQGYRITASAATTPPIEVATQLAHDQLLPHQWGFSASHIDPSCVAVIVGRQIEAHHLEVVAAQQLGIPTYSYPAYIYHYAQHKQRIVVLGDEQTVARFFAIAIHVMNYWGRVFDYVTHLPLDATYPPIQLSEAPVIFLQGDTSVFSAFDPRVIGSIYQPHIVVMTDLDTKLNNTTSNWQGYTALLSDLADAIPKAGKFIYNADITELRDIGAQPRVDVQNIPFHVHAHKTRNGQSFLTTSQGDIPFQWGDAASLKAVSGVHSLLKELAVTDAQFYEAIASFLNGVSRS